MQLERAGRVEIERFGGNRGTLHPVVCHPGEVGEVCHAAEVEVRYRAVRRRGAMPEKGWLIPHNLFASMTIDTKNT